MNKIPFLPIILTFVVLLFVGFYSLNSYIYNQKQQPNEITPPFTGSVAGEFTCLPHKDTSGPITLECAYGFKNDSGQHYALDMKEIDLEKFRAGERATLTGRFTPLEVLSTDHWQKYDIVGIFSVEEVE